MIGVADGTSLGTSLGTSEGESLGISEAVGLSIADGAATGGTDGDSRAGTSGGITWRGSFLPGFLSGASFGTTDSKSNAKINTAAVARMEAFILSIQFAMCTCEAPKHK